MKAILVSALAATVSAEAIRVIARDIVEVRELMARQASGADSSSCAAALSGLLPIATSVPTPPADLESALASITITDPCNVPTNLPASALSELSAYEAQILSWYTAHSAQLESALSACPAVTSYLSNAPVCTAGSGSGGSGSGQSSATATSSGSGTKQTGTSSSGSGSNSTSSGSGSTTSGSGSTISSAAKGVFSAGLVAGAFIVAVLAL